MRFELVCEACGHVLRTVAAAAGQDPEVVLARYETAPRRITCPCGRDHGLGGVDGHEPVAVLRGRGGAEVGRGRGVAALRGLHEAHLQRGGRYDPPAPRARVGRRDPPGTVTIQTPQGPVKVLPGRLEVVAGLVVDTRGGRASVTAAPSSVPTDRK